MKSFSEIILCFFREKLASPTVRRCFPNLVSDLGSEDAKEMAFYHASLGIFFDIVHRILDSLRFMCLKKYLFLSFPPPAIK